MELVVRIDGVDDIRVTGIGSVTRGVLLSNVHKQQKVKISFAVKHGFGLNLDIECDSIIGREGNG